MKHYQVMRWDAISGIIEEDGLSARQRDEENPFKVDFSKQNIEMDMFFGKAKTFFVLDLTPNGPPNCP